MTATTSSGPHHAFNPCGPLPTGVTVLEASAGTGKTFTIAALTARYVAEGTPLDKLLVITFTRIATGELRERVRERLVQAAEGLAGALAGVEPPAGDDVLRFLADAPPAEVARRHERLAKAIADFDAATIETTHGFCLHVLTSLGTAGDIERDVTLVEDAGDLLEEVVDDLYVRRFWRAGRPAPFRRGEALEIGQEVLKHPTAEILPPLSDERDAPAMRRRLAEAVRREIERRKRETGIQTYDDVLTRLRDTLADKERGPAACARLRARYEVVLVDEFQDTDPVQWEIMERAFGDGATTLVLIGDPKQAIYAFRGADVFAYLKAAAEATTDATLKTNWRADQALIDAYDALFAGSHLGHAGIAYPTVEAAPTNRLPRLLGAPVSAPLRVRVVHRDDGVVPLTAKSFAAAPATRELIARDLAADLAALLASGAEVRRYRRDGSHTDAPIRPGHVAVLVRSRTQAATVSDVLRDAGIPAVLGGAGSVFDTQPATEWLRLLDALERPAAHDHAAVAALTAFVGWTADEVAAAGLDAWEELHWRLHRWAALLRRRGVAALLENVTATQHLPERVLSRRDGERFLTDLRHVGELLHGAAVSEGLGSTALAAWLRRRVAEAREDVDNEERTRRLESDAEAVQVLTIHRSKGLEFPVVYCPYLWDFHSPQEEVPVFHDPDNGDVRTLDVSGAGSDFAHHQRADLVERRGEDLRLMYVALTRACHQAVMWWAGSAGSRHSPLGRLIFCRDADGTVKPVASRQPGDDEFAARLAGLGGGIAVERVGPPADARWRPAAGAPVELVAGAFGRTLDERWRRTSYSAITQAAHDLRVGSEPEEEVISDEDVPAAALPPLGLGEMPGGAAVGTLIHRVLEHTDFAAPDLPAALRSALDAQLALRQLDLGDLDTVVAGLATAIGTPLGELVDGFRLCDIGRGDRLDELTFELPLVGGDTPSAELSVRDLGPLLRAHLGPDDPLRSYAERLAEPLLDRDLRGYLTGSLDVVLRLSGPRFVVADYKTNRLASFGPDALHREMVRADYPIQALLYTVALHRYLRWRVRDYDPSRNLAGVLYLFLRGMSGPAAAGVWSWRPPAALVVALSDLFDRGRA